MAHFSDQLPVNVLSHNQITLCIMEQNTTPSNPPRTSLCCTSLRPQATGIRRASLLSSFVDKHCQTTSISDIMTQQTLYLFNNLFDHTWLPEASLFGAYTTRLCKTKYPPALNTNKTKKHHRAKPHHMEDETMVSTKSTELQVVGGKDICMKQPG